MRAVCISAMNKMWWHVFFKNPLRDVYMNGPSALGLWAGKRAADICAELTKVPAVTWELMASECVLLIDRQFNSIYVTASFILYLSVTYHMLTQLWFKFFILRPALNTLRDIQINKRLI